VKSRSTYRIQVFAIAGKFFGCQEVIEKTRNTAFYRENKTLVSLFL
jgi:hypothetical protein